MPWRVVALITVAACFASGCRADGERDRPGAGPVLAVKMTGGFAPVSLPYRPPDVVLYGNGRIVASERHRPSSARTAWVTSGFVERIVRRAHDVGLDRGRRVRSTTQVADGISTTLVFTHDGRRSVTVVDPGAGDELRELAADLRPETIGAADRRTAPHPYRTAKIAVLAGPAAGQPDHVRRWPLPQPARVPALGRTACRLAQGAEAAKATRLAGGHRVWRVHGAPGRVTAMPLLPGERSCADLARRP